MVYVALLRGINVGGKNRIEMAALKACVEDQGLRNVTTFIQSGNVIFEAGRTGGAALTRRIEEALASTFGYAARVATSRGSRAGRRRAS